MATSTTRFEYPDTLDKSEKLAFGVGALLMEWGVCETLLYGIVDAMIGKADSPSGFIVWLSLRNTRDRIELLLRLSREHPAVRDEIAEACRRFKAVTKVRNFFCHAHYRADMDGKITGVAGYQLTDNDEPIRQEHRPLTKGLLNEVASAKRDAERLNLDLWRLLVRVQTTLGVSHPRLPPTLDEYLNRADPPTRR